MCLLRLQERVKQRLFDTFSRSIQTNSDFRSLQPHGHDAEKEREGKDYYFLSEEEFKVLIEDDSLVEWEEVYSGRYYGTLKSEVEKVIRNGKKLLFDIDVYGAQSIKDKYGDRCLAVFVKPPSFNTLIARLKGRKTEDADSLKKRVARIKKELLFEHSFDYVLLNDKLEDTLAEARKTYRRKLDLNLHMILETKTTEGITIRIGSFYEKASSRPVHHYFAFSYVVEIENNSSFDVQLLRRFWQIKDSNLEIKREWMEKALLDNNPLSNRERCIIIHHGPHWPRP